MPNGGHPMHMVLKPRGSREYVVYCRGPEMMVIPAADWEAHRSVAKATLRLDPDECDALARFLGRWVEEWGEVPSGPTPREIDYDY